MLSPSLLPKVSNPNNNKGDGCVTHFGPTIYIKKYLKAKEEEYMENSKYLFHHAKI
jgi:hypothetical protein